MKESGRTTVESAGRRTAEVAQYQAGAVVSRILLKSDAGSVTVFAFDRGQGLSEHTVPHDALVFLLEGEAEFRISGRSRRVAGGEWLLLPANEPHAVSATDRFKMILVMLKG